MRLHHFITLFIMALACCPRMEAATYIELVDVQQIELPSVPVQPVEPSWPAPKVHEHPITSIYAFPQGNSWTFSHPDWHRMWVNTAVLSGAFVGTLFVLEMLPEDATTWNRKSLQQVPLFTRWWHHVMVHGPEWDHDNPIFNYVLHPYAGAAYFMGARSCGFNFWGSLLYSAAISTVEWEFGIEAFMERPSIQDIFITPLVGSMIGEGFYRLKRNIVNHDYRLFGSPILGNVVAFVIDPVNEVIGLFGGNPARRWAKQRKAWLSSSPWVRTDATGHRTYGLSATITF